MFEKRTIPASESEFNMMTYLSYLRYMLDLKGDGKPMADRVKELGLENECHEITCRLDKVFWKLFDTLPEYSQRKMLKMNKAQELRVVNIGSSFQNRLTTMATDDLLGVLRESRINICNICDGEAQDMAKCKMRKYMKNIVALDVKKLDEACGICAFKRFEW